MSLQECFTAVPYFTRLALPYLCHGVSYLRFLHYVSGLKRQGKQFGVVNGTNAVFEFDLRDLVIPSYMYTRHLTYSQEDIELFFRFAKEKCGTLPQSGFFLDIGANIGTTTVHVAKNIGPGLQVIAFEPDRLNFRLLRANCEHNGCKNVTLFNTALSNQTGVKTLQVFAYNRGKCMLVPGPDSASSGIPEKEKDTEEVAVCTLDQCFRENALPGSEVRYIWIDVEGHEAHVIDGMMELLRQYHPPMLMEFTPKGVPCMTVDEQDFALLNVNLKQAYSHMVAWPLNDPKHPAESPITYLEELFHSGTQQYNLFLY